MPRVVHVIGNGDSASFYNEAPRKGLKLTCNLPPFEVPDAYASIIVDFKMMRAIHRGEIDVPGQWVLGMRPKIYMEKNTQFHVQRSHQIRQFYTEMPKYCPNYTDFSCGHMAVYYAAKNLKAEIIHMYGFDVIFDWNLRSSSDFFMQSDRGNMNNNRLQNNWRPVWERMFNDFKDVKFKLHHMHDNIKIKVGDNVETVRYGKRGEITAPPQWDKDKPPIAEGRQ